MCDGERKSRKFSLSQLSRYFVVASIVPAVYNRQFYNVHVLLNFSRKNREIRNSIIKRDIHARCIITRFTITEEEYYRNCEFNCNQVRHSQFVEIPQN